MTWQKWATQSRATICVYEAAGKRCAGISSTRGTRFLPRHFDSTICVRRMECVQSRGKPAKMATRVPFSTQGAPDGRNARHVLRARRFEKRSMMTSRGSARAPVALGGDVRALGAHAAFKAVGDGDECHDNYVIDDGHHDERLEGAVGDGLYALSSAHHVHEADGCHQR